MRWPAVARTAAHSSRHIRIHPTRTNRRHPNSSSPTLVTHGLAQTKQGKFAGAVGSQATFAALPAHRNQNLNATFSVGCQLRPGGTRQPPRSHQVHIDGVSDVLFFAGLKQERHAAEDPSAMDHAVEAAEMLIGGLDPSLGCRRVLRGIGTQQHPFAPSQVGIQGRLLQRFQIAKPKAEAVAVGKSAFRDRTTNPTACTTNQESAHGYQGEGLQR